MPCKIVLTTCEAIFDYDAKKEEIREEEQHTLAPDFWNDSEEAEKFSLRAENVDGRRWHSLSGCADLPSPGLHLGA